MATISRVTEVTGKVSSGDFQAGLSFADNNLNQVGNAAQVLESATSQEEIALLGNSVNEVQLKIILLDRPVLLHFNTVKGRGMPEAEENPTKYHQMSLRSESEPC